MKFIIAVVGGTILMAALLIFLPSLGERSTGGKIAVSPKDYDAGTVSMAAGLVKKTYEVKNEGSGPLKITGILTSCHCTTASLKLGDKTSPSFGMEPTSFWSEVIAAGQSAQLEVVFDPSYHGDAGLGQVTRGVYISSNDTRNKRVELLLSANVIH